MKQRSRYEKNKDVSARIPRKKIGWNYSDNVPVFDAGRTLLTPIRDVWIMSSGEKHELIETLVVATGIDKGLWQRIFSPVTIAHRIPAPLGEFAIEVWGHGLKLLSAEIDPKTSYWRIYPTGALASLTYTLGGEPVELHVRRRLKGTKIEIPSCKDMDLCLVKSGKYVGFASKRGTGYKVRDMAPTGFKVLSSSTIEDYARANRPYIERLVSEAREFIRQHAGDQHVYVAVSGGADSTAAALLAVEALGPSKVTLVYADTKMEFPESHETVRKLAGMLGVRLDIVSGSFDPVAEISRRGLMSRKNRWCTRILKLEPLRRYYYSKNARIIIDGARAYESTTRAANKRVGENPAIPGIKRLLPILYWTRMEVQAYLILRNAPINPLYEKGLVRIGCILCPAMSLHELRLASNLYPEFYDQVASAIESPGVVAAREFILAGKWRKL
ncbi:MAG: phosphoadenosine phosphosulfate reductase family protein [Desulfurococcales archaeon]|nr:phosphoadenosine phosphosulfate reductase family protein [Desulfurococcales archaeon]